MDCVATTEQQKNGTPYSHKLFRFLSFPRIHWSETMYCWKAATKASPGREISLRQGLRNDAHHGGLNDKLLPLIPPTHTHTHVRPTISINLTTHLVLQDGKDGMICCRKKRTIMTSIGSLLCVHMSGRSCLPSLLPFPKKPLKRFIL